MSRINRKIGGLCRRRFGFTSKHLDEALPNGNGQPPTKLVREPTDQKGVSDSGFFGSGDCNNNNRTARDLTWCKLAYWEECRRVGPLIPVTASSVNVSVSEDVAGSSSTPAAKLLKAAQNYRDKKSNLLRTGGKVRLNAAFCHNGTPAGSTLRLRQKIGKGFVLSRESEDVWLRNITDIPLFVSSPTLVKPSIAKALPVHKLPPGFRMKVFDRRQKSRSHDPPPAMDGPFHSSSLRVSLGKGWGGNYSRQDVMSCPCWIEILLVADKT